MTDDDDVSYFLAVAKVLEQKERDAVVTIKQPGGIPSQSRGAMSPTPGAPLAIRTDAGSPRPPLSTVASSPNPAAYVPSYHGPEDEAQKQKFHFDPTSDRVVMLYDGHDEEDAQISPFSPEPPSPHKGPGTGEEAAGNQAQNGHSPSDAAGTKRGRGGASRGRGGRRGGGPPRESEHSDAPSAGPKEPTTTPTAKSSKPAAKSPVIVDGQDGWGGSGYDVSLVYNPSFLFVRFQLVMAPGTSGYATICCFLCGWHGYIITGFKSCFQDDFPNSQNHFAGDEAFISTIRPGNSTNRGPSTRRQTLPNPGLHSPGRNSQTNAPRSRRADGRAKASGATPGTAPR